MAKALKSRASKQLYISPAQPSLPGFESPFSKHLNPLNRWIVLAKKIPWDEPVGVYQKQMNNSKTGADGINPRVVIGSLIIKHMCDLTHIAGKVPSIVKVLIFFIFFLWIYRRGVRDKII